MYIPIEQNLATDGEMLSRGGFLKGLVPHFSLFELYRLRRGELTLFGANRQLWTMQGHAQFDFRLRKTTSGQSYCRAA
jgi:hypothetical protein